VEIIVARSRRTRLLGLALRRRPPTGRALLLPRCCSVHTVGMRFALDFVWLDSNGIVVAIDERVPPLRVRTRRTAAAVIEAPAGEGHEAAAAWAASRRSGIIQPMAETRESPNRWLEAFDPRVPLYRDTYNEYLVFIVSAIGAVAGTQVPLYLVMAVTDLWPVEVFVPACMLFELAVIFGIARPQMKPKERVGWALLWAFATGVLALCFYYLVAEPTL
jgi:uncharacterized membrane protein (UPF0127 family)